MKTNCIKIALTAVSLLLAANLAFAVEVKVATPDVKGAAKAAGGSTKVTAAGAKAGAKDAAADAKAVAKAKVVDINTASEAELKAVPGIGDAYAAKIIAGRPYAKKDQLKSRKILPVPVYEKTKGLIIATQPKK
jgi:DNA uptake protein ComE-like DNA-binding protein